MRKIFLILLPFILTGCLLSSEQKLMNAIEKTNAVKNFQMDAVITIEDEENSVNAEMVQLVDVETGITKMTMDMDMGSISFKVETYSNETTTYTKNIFGSGWVKADFEEEDALEVLDYTSLPENAISIKEIDSEEKGVTSYEVLIEKEYIESLMKTLDTTVEEGYTLKDEVKFIFSIKDGYLYEIYVNMLDFMEFDEAIYTKLDVKFKLSNYNTTSVTIPQNIIDTATEEAEFDFDFDFDWE
jgi:hypothetical protein